MSEELTFRAAIEMTQAIFRRFEKVEQRPWGVEGSMIELSKQVGDLARAVMIAERYYLADRPEYHADLDRIGDELADILYAVMRIAEHYGIDLVDAHVKARQGEDAYLKRLGV